MGTVVCFGDSNTHGVDPVTLERFPREVRWTGLLARQLGDLAYVVEEGLNGRTTVWEDPYTEFRSGKAYLLPCLRSHAPVDLLVLMLGTNDLKAVFGRSAPEIAAGAGALVDIALASGAGVDGRAPAVLLVAPPRLGVTTDRSELWGFGEARAKSEQLSRLYRNAAELKGVAFLDAGQLVAGDPADGVHLSAADHAILATAVASAVREMLA